MKIRNLPPGIRRVFREMLRNMNSIKQSAKDFDYEQRREELGLPFKQRTRKRNQYPLSTSRVK